MSSRDALIANMIALLAVVFAGAYGSVFPYGETAHLSQVQSQTTSNCPDKWFDASFLDMGCLSFNTTQDYTWEDANNACRKSSNSTLVDVATEEQMVFLQMELEVIAEAEGKNHHWWTAGTDLGFEGRWIWITTLTAVEDFVWNSGEPGVTTLYNCLELHPDYGYLGFDEICNSERFPICQLK